MGPDLRKSRSLFDIIGKDHRSELVVIRQQNQMKRQRAQAEPVASEIAAVEPIAPEAPPAQRVTPEAAPNT